MFVGDKIKFDRNRSRGAFSSIAIELKVDGKCALILGSNFWANEIQCLFYKPKKLLDHD